jgi:hypothetical protein
MLLKANTFHSYRCYHEFLLIGVAMNSVAMLLKANTFQAVIIDTPVRSGTVLFLLYQPTSPSNHPLPVRSGTVLFLLYQPKPQDPLPLQQHTMHV